MVPFAGYEMPVQYAAGVLKEHIHTRFAAGLFDVSHMGQITLRPRSGDIADAARALERLAPADIESLQPGRQRYAVFTTETGGISDDLMVAHAGSYLFLVVNASRKAEDEALLRAGLEDVCEIQVLDRALLAMQGPLAEPALSPYAPGVASMKFMDARWESVMGIECFVSRSGYTGEDGFEVSVSAEQAGDLWDALLKSADVQPIGLGARDSLRLEAGLCLYGNDIDLTTTPVEAALEWSIAKRRRSQFEAIPKRRRVGLKPDSRPVRAGAPLFASETSADAIGSVTSGGFGPTVNGPISMGYVPTNLATPGTRLFANVRGERHPVSVVQLPFVAHRYKR
jgi:aminomethyltransferase